MKPNRVGAFLDKSMPDILMGLGIVLNGAAVIDGIRNTPKALEKIRDAEEQKGGEKLTPEETFSAVWRCYISTAVEVVLGDACIIGGGVAYHKRNAGLLALCSLGESTIRLYQDKLIEAVGSEKAEQIEDEIANKQLEEKAKTDKKINEIMKQKQETIPDYSYGYEGSEDKRYILPSDIAIPCYDVYSGRIFYARKAEIEAAVNECNAQIISSDEISLNDFYYMLGMEPIDMGYEYGWKSTDKLVDISYGDKEINGVHFMTIKFRNRPTKLMW